MTSGGSVQGGFAQLWGAPAQEDVSLEIAAGKFVVLLGPSGCGKTTLLNILGGFAEPDAGRVPIGGQDRVGVGQKGRPMSTVFQPGLFTEIGRIGCVRLKSL